MTRADPPRADALDLDDNRHNVLINIDDLRGLLRELKRGGYTAKRQGRLSIWKVEPMPTNMLLVRCLIDEIYVDKSRTVPRGKYITMPIAKWEIKLRVEPMDFSVDSYGLLTRWRYGRW